MRILKRLALGDRISEAITATNQSYAVDRLLWTVDCDVQHYRTGQ
jgi:hypothetical protein